MVKALAFVLGLTLAMATQAGLPENIARIKPSIVAIATYQKLRSPALQIRGSGFVVGDGQSVATNQHVLPESLAADEQMVVVVPGMPMRVLEAEAGATDRDHDLALLRIQAPIPALRLDAQDDVRDGQEIFFTGFPIGGALGTAATVTHRGIVSASLTPMALPGGNVRQINAAAIRQLRNGPLKIYQLDATAYPGSSGSPLFDADSGEVIGIVNSGFVKASKEAALSSPSGITFAIPVRYLRELLATQRR